MPVNRRPRRLLPRFLGPAVLVAVLLGAWSEVGAEGILWMEYRQALRTGEEEGRPIFLYFFSNRCAYCKKMDEETFRTRAVVEYLRDTFVSARIQADRNPHLARKYLVRGLPTCWFLSPAGKGILALPGYLSPEQFRKVLRYVGGGYYRSQSLKEFLEGS